LKPTLQLLDSHAWRDYELIDSGDGAKLERFGEYTFVRPEHQALWTPKQPKGVWDRAHAVFLNTSGEETGGQWQIRKPIKPDWIMKYQSILFKARFTKSRHFGVFPEQAAQWDWVIEVISQAGFPVKVLNLFGYTGLASLSAALAGAQVTHVDASKKTLTWARENQALSGLEDRSIRWIVDDALKFVLRENRRGVLYDGIIMDPPKFGRGPKGEVWTSVEMLPRLLHACVSILSPKPVFFVLTAYAIRVSALSLYNALSQIMGGKSGKVSCGELVVGDSGAHRDLSLAIFARWSSSTIS
jgi:23S rRNA (cytosine1962-C5)-methyltransferase